MNTSNAHTASTSSQNSSLQKASSPSTLSLFFKREFSLLLRNSSDSLQPYLFFIIVVFLFPLSMTPDPTTLQTVMPGFIWVSVVLATMMGLDNLFRSDFEDGTLEQVILSPRSLALVIIAKIVAHWLTTGVLLSLLAAIISFAIGLPSTQVVNLFVSLFLGTLSLQLIGAVGAALTVSLQRNGMLLAVIVLPLYIPILIFGAGATTRSTESIINIGPLYMLAAIAILSLTLAPIAISASLKNSVD